MRCHHGVLPDAPCVRCQLIFRLCMADLYRALMGLAAKETPVAE